MKDHRSVALSLAFVAAFFFFRAGFAYWMLGQIVPIAEMLRLVDDNPSVERFPENVRFSIVLFGILGLAALASGLGVLFRQRWARLVWLVTCTVLSFSYLYSLLVNPDVALKQFDLIFVCVISWILLRGNGLSRSSAP